MRRPVGLETLDLGVEGEISLPVNPIQQQWLFFVGNPQESIKISSRAGWAS
ncbi:MAG: hypothetical protein ACO3Q1_00110 [Candidatus Nanopelagicales bacterium]